MPLTVRIEKTDRIKKAARKKDFFPKKCSFIAGLPNGENKTGESEL